MVLEEYADDALVKDVVVALMKVVRAPKSSLSFGISRRIPFVFRSP
jgi:hypothetical protein